MGFKEGFVRENLFVLGCLCIFIGVMIFFGANPRYMRANSASIARVIEAVFVLLGLVLLGVDRYLKR